MKPLPEPFEVVDPNEPFATALLEHVPPLEPSATRKRRIWMALERAGARRPQARMRAPIIAICVLFGATAASATLPGLWKHLQPSNAEVAAVTPNADESVSSPRRAPPIAPASATPPEPPISRESTLPESRTPAPIAKAIETGPTHRKTAAEKSRATPELAAPPASAALVVEAIRERRAGNLVRAKELSAEYRARYPGGALQEEALALSIEAAAALGDDEARGLATLYLRRYPNGRFRTQAQRVVAASR